MAKICWIIIAIMFCCYAAFAQQTTLDGVKSQLDAMFAGLDKTKVSTGFLWDTAVNLVEGDHYNGSALTDSNFVSLPVMGDMLQSINSASVGADTICVQAALSRIERNSSLHIYQINKRNGTYVLDLTKEDAKELNIPDSLYSWAVETLQIINKDGH